MVIAVILGGAVCPEPILKSSILDDNLSRPVYEKSPCPKINFESMFYIRTIMIFFKNRFLKIDLGQTAPPKMTAMTIG